MMDLRLLATILFLQMQLVEEIRPAKRAAPTRPSAAGG
jgi:hypothetical protein